MKQVAVLIIFFISTLLFSINISQKVALAAEPGCYDGTSTKLSSCPSSPPAVYDNAKGANIKPDPLKCYVYSQNLYEGDLSFGDPYLEVSCDTLSPCPKDQELRYNEGQAKPPRCVDVDTPLDNTFAGGALPPGSTTSIPIKIDCEPPKGTSLDRTNCGIINIIIIAINFLSALAGVVFVASIMIAGFQYMTARDNAGQVQKARSRIVMTLVAVAIYIFMYALLNFFVPGGVLP